MEQMETNREVVTHWKEISSNTPEAAFNLGYLKATEHSEAEIKKLKAEVKRLKQELNNFYIRLD